MAIGFSSTMGTRRRMNMADHSRENRLNTEEKTSEKSGWDELAKMGDESTSPAEAWAKMASEMKDKEPLTWENMDEGQKKTRLSTDIDKFFDDHDSWEWNRAGFFKNAPLSEEESYYDKRKRKINEAETTLANGKGYKYIQRLKTIVSEKPDLKASADELSAHIQEIDAHHGLTPREYRQLKKAK